MINLNDLTPAPVTGGTNVLWQEDVSGNISAYYLRIKKSVSSVAGVLTVDASQGESFKLPVTEAITSMSITNPTDGQEITLLWVQDGTGHAVTLATNLHGALAVDTGANKVTCQKFTYNLSDTNWYAVGIAGM